MTQTDVATGAARPHAASGAYRALYRLLGYFGLFSIMGAVLYGFRADAAAPAGSYGFNAALFAIFIIPHLIMTRSWWKARVWGDPAGHPTERRFYIFVTVVTWLGLLALHRPVPGPALSLPAWVSFAGVVLFLWCFLVFFQGVTFAMLDGLLGVPGAVSAFSHGPETPLFTEGAYASVRHPMYRAFILMALASLLIHPHAGQLFWIALLGATFIMFIPIEEAQMIRARGDDYREYCRQTRWRLFRGIW